MCEQERISRVRGAGFNSTGLPDEALNTVLERQGLSRSDVQRYVLADSGDRPEMPTPFECIDRHLAYASTSYLTSSFVSATVVVCDDETPRLSVWKGLGPNLVRVDWPWSGPGFADVYTRCAEAFGFHSGGGEQRFEALARLRPANRDGRVERLLSGNHTSVSVSPDLEAEIEAGLSGQDLRGRAGLAAALQARLSELFIEFLAEVQRQTDTPCLCLAGKLFYNSSINSAVKQARVFSEVFVPVDPGTSGLAVALLQLPQAGLVQSIRELRLARQDDVEQLRCRSLDVTEEPHFLQQLEGHTLGFVDNQRASPSCPVVFSQEYSEGLQKACLRLLRIHTQMKPTGDELAELVASERWVVQEHAVDAGAVQFAQDCLDERGLARTGHRRAVPSAPARSSTRTAGSLGPHAGGPSRRETADLASDRRVAREDRRMIRT